MDQTPSSRPTESTMARSRSSPRSVERPSSNRMKRAPSPFRTGVATRSSRLADGLTSVPVSQVEVRTMSERTPRRACRALSGKLSMMVCRPAGKKSARTGACSTCSPPGRTAAAAAQGRSESIVPLEVGTCAPAAGISIALSRAAAARPRADGTRPTGLAGGGAACAMSERTGREPVGVLPLMTS
jgi:hypothetical protein